LAWCAGSAWQLHQPALFPAYPLLALGVGATVIAAWAGGWVGQRGGRLGRLCAGMVWAVAVATLAVAVVNLRADARLAQTLSPALEGQDLRVEGVVAAMPQAFAGASAGGLRFVFEPVAAKRLSGEAVSLPPRLWVGWYAGLAHGELNGLPELKVGDRWRLTLRLKRPHGSANPHGFDYELWLFEQGLGATGYVRSQPPPERLGMAWTPMRWVERARQITRDALFKQVSDDRAAGVLAALVVGDQRAIDRAEWDLFRATGVAHLMSISGLHVTMFAWLAAGAVGWAWRRSARLCLHLPAPHAARVGGFALALAYAVFSGFGVPAQRTVWMVGTVTLIGLLGLRWRAWRVLLASGSVVVLADPWALLQPGFWLSFVAVAMLFAASPMGQAGREGAPWWQRLAREQWVATLALAPLGLLFFQQASLVGLVANAVAIPMVTLLITPLALAGGLVPLAWALAAWLTQGLLLILQALVAVSPAPFTLPAPGWAATGLAMMGVSLLVMRLPWAARLLALPLLLPLLLPALAPRAWQAAHRPPPGQFELLAADVGQGTAVIVRTASSTWLYDAGPRYSAEADAGDRVLVPLLRALGERRLSGLVVSHRDADHAGGAASVLKAYPGTPVLTSVAETEVRTWTAPEAPPSTVMRCDAGQHWTVDGVRFEVLHPQADDHAQAGTRPNALSCVLRVVAQPTPTAGAAKTAAADGQAALLTGDIERLQELALAARAGSAALRAEVLLVPHHGSNTSSTVEFLRAVAPSVAVVQAGYRNRFGHPTAAVLARYSAIGAAVTQSPLCGAWRWRSDDQDPKGQCWRQAYRRTWHIQK
jgi:competence protein ComEC